MAKGFFTQGAAVLLSEPVSLDQVALLLGERFQRRGQARAPSVWIGGKALVAQLESHPTGVAVVDVIDQPWPDHMGDPKTDPMLFAAWGMGHLGPLTFPRNLQRALQQSSLLSEVELAAVRGHRAFVRVLFTYVAGASPDTPVVPEAYVPSAEVDELLAFLLELLKIPAAVAAFNPNGETLHSRETLASEVTFARENNLPPLGAYSKMRLVRPDVPSWLLMDTVGMGQVDAPDHEACFQEDRFDPNEVARFLRNAANYVLKKGDVIKSGDTMNGPGDVNWQGFLLDESLTSPPRPVYRWLPLDGTRAPAQLVPPGLEPEHPKKKGLFGWLKS